MEKRSPNMKKNYECKKCKDEAQIVHYGVSTHWTPLLDGADLDYENQNMSDEITILVRCERCDNEVYINKYFSKEMHQRYGDLNKGDSR
jgi:hypothetical protein